MGISSWHLMRGADKAAVDKLDDAGYDAAVRVSAHLGAIDLSVIADID
jgi:hypothetical protein